MIHIDRDRADEQGRPIRPGASWFARAARGRERAAAEAGAHEADPGIYADDWVKAALEELFHRKCAYCEAPIGAEADWNVEHFRPKGRVAERHGHPGYYWLAYEWLNLYPVCEHCNQRRKDRPLWGDLQFAEAGGKQDQFPLEDEATRAMAPGDALAREARLLLDPCEDRPEEHLRFTVDGQIVAVTGDRKGEVSIEVFHLRRRRARDARRNVISEVVALLKLIRKSEADGRQEAAADLRRFLEDFRLADSCPYAAAARAVVRDPAVFGV
ncbi:MAG TPA: hypothetical protein DD490_00685 [Acidobacteria bacterium]|nr:hypothetical protein [Acidobacteriota bacterium]